MDKEKSFLGKEVKKVDCISLLKTSLIFHQKRETLNICQNKSTSNICTHKKSNFKYLLVIQNKNTYKNVFEELLFERAKTLNKTFSRNFCLEKQNSQTPTMKTKA